MSNSIFDKSINKVDADISRGLTSFLDLVKTYGTFEDNFDLMQLQDIAQNASRNNKMSERDRLKFKKIEAQLLKRK